MFCSETERGKGWWPSPLWPDNVDNEHSVVNWESTDVLPFSDESERLFALIDMQPGYPLRCMRSVNRPTQRNNNPNVVAMKGRLGPRIRLMK